MALTPTTLQVDPGAEFDLRITVTQSGPVFDSYHAVVAYDPEVLTFLQLPASVQEGSYMKNACGSTFHYFVTSPFALDISHALVCSGLSLTGPGELYVLRFRAASQVQSTDVFFTQIEFARAGSPVAVESSDPAVIQIGDPTDSGAEHGVAALRCTLAPNPVASTATLRIESFGRAPEFVEVVDVRGRMVHRRAWSDGQTTPRYVWTPRDENGSRLPSGIYFVRVGSGDQRIIKRITVLD